MKTFLLWRIDEVDYDEYDSIVVVAKDELAARSMLNDKNHYYWESADWTNEEIVKCEIINSNTKAGVVLASLY